MSYREMRAQSSAVYGLVEMRPELAAHTFAMLNARKNAPHLEPKDRIDNGGIVSATNFGVHLHSFVDNALEAQAPEAAEALRARLGNAYYLDPAAAATHQNDVILTKKMQAAMGFKDIDDLKMSRAEIRAMQHLTDQEKANFSAMLLDEKDAQTRLSPEALDNMKQAHVSIDGKIERVDLVKIARALRNHQTPQEAAETFRALEKGQIIDGYFGPHTAKEWGQYVAGDGMKFAKDHSASHNVASVAPPNQVASLTGVTGAVSPLGAPGPQLNEAATRKLAAELAKRPGFTDEADKVFEALPKAAGRHTSPGETRLIALRNDVMARVAALEAQEKIRPDAGSLTAYGNKIQAVQQEFYQGYAREQAITQMQHQQTPTIQPAPTAQIQDSKATISIKGDRGPAMSI